MRALDTVVAVDTAAALQAQREHLLAHSRRPQPFPSVPGPHY